MGWKMEVFRMAAYITFPVTLFYVFNQPQFFEEAVLEKKAKYFPPSDPTMMKFFDNLQKEAAEIREKRKSSEQKQ